LDEETYPSGRVVKNIIDSNGDLAMVESRKNSSSGLIPYARAFSYTAAGAVSSMQLGNGRWESTAFNNRLQPTDIDLGAVQGHSDLLNLHYDYGTTDNNENVKTQTIDVLTVGANTGFTAVQTYTYDSLDRIKSASETIGGSQSWKQTFNYDRYGNRNFDSGNTTIRSVDSIVTKVVDPEVLASNNRFKLDQDNDGTNDYEYDSSGNLMTNAKGQSFTFDAENLQTTATGANLNTSYSYDGDNRRVKTYDAINDQTTIFVYDASGQLAAEYTINVPTPSDPTISYLTNDAIGSVRVSTNSFGDVKARRDFLPFGEELYAGLGGGAHDCTEIFV